MTLSHATTLAVSYAVTVVKLLARDVTKMVTTLTLSRSIWLQLGFTTIYSCIYPLLIYHIHLDMSTLFEVFAVTFPEILRTLRTERQLTQKELASKASVSVLTIQHYELATRDPVPHQLIAIADVLHVSLDELVGHKPIALDSDPLYSQILHLTPTQREEVEKYVDYVLSRC